MKVALIGDIHANLPALESVLAHARQKGVDALWNVGDSVGYGAFPDEVVARLQESGALSILGNYDRKVLRQKGKKNKEPRGKCPEKWLACRWTYDHLSKASRKYLRSLPEAARLGADGRRILLVHGSPESIKEPLTPETPAARLCELAEQAQADVVICGHSHQPFKRKASGVWFINTGSIGRPDDGDPRASYAILQIGSRFLRMRHYRIAYDVERAVAAIRERRLPELFAQTARREHSLDALIQQFEEGAGSWPRGGSIRR